MAKTCTSFPAACPWDDYVNFQLGPALLHADAPLELDPPPPSPQGSLTGMFPHRLSEVDRRLGDTRSCATTQTRGSTRPRRSVSHSERFDRNGHIKPGRWQGSGLSGPRSKKAEGHRPGVATRTPGETDRGMWEAAAIGSARPQCAPDNAAKLRAEAAAPVPLNTPVRRLSPLRTTLSVTPVLHTPGFPGTPASPSRSPSRPASPTRRHSILWTPLPDPTSRNRLARRSTLTLSLSGTSRHRVRMWRASPLAPLVVRLAAPAAPNLNPILTPMSPHITGSAAANEPPGVWEEDGTDPYAPVRERISTCQDRITEYAWALAYGSASVSHAGRGAPSSSTGGISRRQLLDAALVRPRRSSLLARPAPETKASCCGRRFSFGWEREQRDTSGWERESSRASNRIEHFEHLQEHYLALMAPECGRRRTAHVRMYHWGWEKERLPSA